MTACEVKYLIDNTGNMTLQFRLLTADSPTVAKAVRLIDNYLSVRRSDRQTAGMTMEDKGEWGQFTKVAEALTTHTGTLTI